MSLLACSLLLAGSHFAPAADSAAPKGFTSLFDGKDLKGWKVLDGDKAAWGVEDGHIYTKADGGGWLMTEKQFGDFELLLEYKIVDKAGNSGVALRSPFQGDPAYTGMEIQILDQKNYGADLKDWQHTGSIYGVVPPSKDVTKGLGEWQSYRITAKGRQVKIELNGTVIVDANLDDHKDKFESHPGLKRKEGHLGLQSHGGRIEFRNIFVKELK
jgi:hypothetical protein